MESNLSLTRADEELIDKFSELSVPEDIAELLEVNYNFLKYYLYILPNSKRYTTFEIPKKTDGVRKITAPATALKIVQQKLNKVLQYVYEPKPSAHGFLPDRGIVSNAKKHSNKKYAFNVDLKDYFPSINFGRVRGLFMAFPYNLPEPVSTVLAQICCHENALPQGAPTSPIVSNMICSKLDTELQQLARKNKCFYTRYADDITFSTNVRNFPTAIAKVDDFGFTEVGSELERIINENGFVVNPSKVRLQSSNQRQEVTGIVVNKFPNVKREFVKERALVI